MTHRNPDTPAPEIVPTHPIAAVMALIAGLKPRARLLGLDVGSTTIGLAISDFSRTIASPLETITRGKLSKDLEALRGIIAGREVGALVIGLPINMDGSEGPRCQSTRQFARNIEPLGLPHAFWDERLSTAAVTRLMIDADMTRKRRGELVDKMAAAYILQGALDAARQAR
ncbi:MAG: Holliday junction resolvase RuvX [Alphaproteobacteria bacterium]|nr:Holliday junction resolvase RuvX [Alphaproteobacteria bacterium]MBU0795818.1 Holliday junction resolvase RuvX [Alphaproteobacteria bacterium]MBU0886680.1 Holliday junction resolvase RuvX [Alphaproteobacteria bacterium]MBU1814535.1 Holliday junction resolvase RuvX [Alphaproteobacteria bacterium]